jgi:hypothetical protein
MHNDKEFRFTWQIDIFYYYIKKSIMNYSSSQVFLFRCTSFFKTVSLLLVLEVLSMPRKGA